MPRAIDQVPPRGVVVTRRCIAVLSFSANIAVLHKPRHEVCYYQAQVVTSGAPLKISGALFPLRGTPAVVRFMIVARLIAAFRSATRFALVDNVLSLLFVVRVAISAIPCGIFVEPWSGLMICWTRGTSLVLRRDIACC